VIRKKEVRLQRLAAELQTCERAIDQARQARQRVEVRLAKELYFQQLFRTKVECHARRPSTEAPPTLEDSLKEGKSPSDLHVAAVAMNNLRLKAEAEARRLRRELDVVLRAHQEEISARLRAQLRAAVSRLAKQTEGQHGAADGSMAGDASALGTEQPPSNVMRSDSSPRVIRAQRQRRLDRQAVRHFADLGPNRVDDEGAGSALADGSSGPMKAARGQSTEPGTELPDSALPDELAGLHVELTVKSEALLQTSNLGACLRVVRCCEIMKQGSRGQATA